MFTNSQILSDPWLHQIVDGFFTANEFIKIQEAAIALEIAYKQKLITANDCLSLADAALDIGEEAFNIILHKNRELLDNLEQICSNFPNHRKFKNYISFPTFHVLPPNTPPQKVHDEAYDKTASIVVYLYPKVSVGTALFRTQDRSSFVKEIEWKQNSAMIFCGEERVTWHDFYSRESTRVTLNFFFRELKTTELLEDNNNYYWNGVDGPGTKIPKTLPQDKIDLLTSGILFK